MQLEQAWREDALGSWHQLADGERTVTVRILHPDRAKEEAPRLLFEEEMRRVTGLKHTHLLKVVDQGSEGLRTWYATEDAREGSLAARVEQGPLSEDEVTAVTDALLKGLAYLNRRKQVHAALTPERLVLLPRGWALTTYRDVRAWDELRALRKRRPGGAAYAPPERFPGHTDSPKALGLVAYQVGGILRAALGGGAPTREDGTCAPLPSDLPERWRGPLTRLLHPNAGMRPQGLPAIERCLKGEDGGAGPTAPKRTYPTAPVPKRRRGRR